MAEHNEQSIQGGRGAARPSLLGARAPQRPPEFSASILDALEDRAPRAGGVPRDRSRGLRWPWLLAVLGVLAAVVGAGAHVGWGSRSVAAREMVAAPAVPMAVVTARATAATTAEPIAVPVAQPAVETAPVTNTAARIEDVPAPPAASMPSTSEAPAAAEPPKRPTRAHAAPHAARGPQAFHAQAKAAPKATPKASKAAPARDVQLASAAPPASRGADSDVEIMAVLMSHMSAANAAPAASPDTIAGLVKGCRRLANPEAVACLHRICRGYWGKAEACPVRERQTARAWSANETP